MIGQLLEREFQIEFPGAVGFSVKGADVAAYWRAGDLRLQRPCVVVARAGTALHQDYMDEAAKCPKIHLIESELEGNLSSTKLRAALFQDDEAGVRAMCPAPAAEYFLAYAKCGQLFTQALARRQVEVQHGPARHARFVVGIAGASCAGKSTLSEALRCELGGMEAVDEEDVCGVVRQGRHRRYATRAEETWVQKGNDWLRNWESPEYTDWDALVDHIVSAAKKHQVVLVKGNCILHDARVRKLLDAVIWLEVDEITCRKRRESCPRGWTKDSYVTECIWPAHCRYRDFVFGPSQMPQPSGILPPERLLLPERFLVLRAAGRPQDATREALVGAALRWLRKRREGRRDVATSGAPRAAAAGSPRI